MLDKETKQNLAQYLDLMEAPVVFSVSTDDTANSQQLFEFVNEVADMTDKITVEQKTLPRTLALKSILYKRLAVSLSQVFL